MKKIIILLIILGVSAGAWFLYTKKQKDVVPPQKGPSGSLPAILGTPQTSGNNTNSDVTKDFNIQINGGESLVLDKPIISENYALQNWSDQNKGGQALLKYNQSQGWVLITMGGGAWSVSDLIKVGVPKAIAEQLLGIKK